MNRIKPYSGLSHKRLEVLIRKHQSPHLPSEVTFTFGSIVNTGLEQKNTQVTVYPKDYNKEFPGRDVSYNRLDLGGLKELPSGELLPYEDIAFPTTTHQILPKLNRALGIDLTPAEVLNEDIAELPVNGLTITLLSVSLAWLEGVHFFGYAPGATEPAARAENLRIPLDERKRIRVLESASLAV